jgi:hypothetical protein
MGVSLGRRHLEYCILLGYVPDDVNQLLSKPSRSAMKYQSEANTLRNTAVAYSTLVRKRTSTLTQRSTLLRRPIRDMNISHCKQTHLTTALVKLTS